MRLSLTIGTVVAFLFGIIILMRYAARQDAPPIQPLVVAEQCSTKTISHEIHASGTLSISNNMKIGTLVSGTIKEVYVEENTAVKKGQPLAEVDPGTNTVDYEKARSALAKAQQEYRYLKKNCDRMEALYLTQQLAQDTFEKLRKDTEKSNLDVAIAQAELLKQKTELENRIIKAPGDGIITSVTITKGESVLGSQIGATSLFELASDICAMQATLDIDESDIGSVKEGLPVSLCINTYPDTPLQSTIKSVSFSPRPTKDAVGNLFYKAVVAVNNTHKKFRPGMGLTASIRINKIADALCIKNFALEINESHLKAAAAAMHVIFSPMSKQDKKEFKKEHPHERTKFVWVCDGTSITEQGIVIGIIDETHVHVKSGLAAYDRVITNVREPLEQKKGLAQRLFSKK